MAETAADLTDNILPRVPVRQWVLSFPIPLRSLFAVHPDLITPVLRILHRAITTFLIGQTDVKRGEAAAGAVTLIQRFGSAANLNTHLHALVLDGVYRTTAVGAPVFHEAPMRKASACTRASDARRTTGNGYATTSPARRSPTKV